MSDKAMNIRVVWDGDDALWCAIAEAEAAVPLASGYGETVPGALRSLAANLDERSKAKLKAARPVRAPRQSRAPKSERSCPECHGSGDTPQHNFCSRCNGNGTIPW